MVKNNGLCALRPPVFVKQFNAVTGFSRFAYPGLHCRVDAVCL